MYRSLITLQAGAHDSSNSRIFIPELASCNIHSVQFDIAGAPGQFETLDFNIEPPFLVLDSYINALLNTDSKFIVKIDYHGLSQSDRYSDLSKSIIQATLDSTPSAAEINAISKRAEIFSKHFSHGQFALDIGLYKEAVLNYGTVLETLLNLDLRHASLNNLINSSGYEPVSKSLMHEIRECRNRVHPEQLSNFGDVSRTEAIKSRHSVNLIMNQTNVISTI